MAKEIERKYLVKGTAWQTLAKETVYRQGYLSTVQERTVRVRTIEDKGYLTIKGISVGATRTEYEYQIPVEDANAMLDELCERPIIEKKRYVLEYEGLIWEIDEFAGVNRGLIIAEVELSDENQKVVLPNWVGEEVTGDPKYFNSNLTKHPYTEW
ncbi:MAG: CYTH domain-containing protein [Calditrichaeota bacterium]|nr:CYTH domain-containing protein [candidate division KSB1 bacterium]MCZ6819570.1 CYTH domain-containing protein [Calditrichota bacterium]